MNKKALCMLLIMVFFVTVFINIQAESIVLRYSEMNSEKTPQGLFTNKFAELVEEKTEGRVKVETYFSSSLVGYDIEPVQTGIADFNQLIPSFVADLHKELSLFGAPFLFDSYEQVLKIVDPRSTILERINKDLSKKGVRLLTAYPMGFRNLTTSKKPIYSPDDLKGLKIRTVPSEAYMETVKAMGATPTPMAFGEVATALATGLIDGQENPYSVIVPNGLHEVQDYVILTRHLMTFAGVFMNQVSWERLSEKDQENMLDAATEAINFITDYIQERNSEWKQTIIETKGIEIIDESNGLKLDEFKRIRDVVAEKFKDDWGSLYNEVLELLNKN